MADQSSAGLWSFQSLSAADLQGLIGGLSWIPISVPSESLSQIQLKNPLDCRNRPMASNGPNPAISSVIFKRRGETCLFFCTGIDRDRNGFDSAGQRFALLPLTISTGFIGDSRVPSARGCPRQACC